MENRYKMILDIKHGVINKARFKQGDTDTSVLDITVVDNGLPVDITGQTIEFNFLKPDGTIVSQDISTGVTIIDSSAGNVECLLKSNTLAVIGLVSCEVVFKGVLGEILSTSKFNIMVEQSIGFGELSFNYISSIENLLIVINNSENVRKENEVLRVSLYNDINTKLGNGELIGPKGDTGIQGIQGIQGIIGLTGPKGDTGIQGLIGLTGPKGDQGIQGIAGSGSTSTTELSIKDYGTIGNGIVNDSIAIQTAIDYAYANKVHTVIFPKGIYMVRNLDFKGGITYVGTGEDSILKSDPTCVDWDVTAMCKNTSNITVKNLSFDGNLGVVHGDGTSGVINLRIENCTNVRVTDCKFMNNGVANIAGISPCNNIWVENNSFYNSDVGVLFTGEGTNSTSNIFVNNNYIEGGTSEGISIFSWWEDAYYFNILIKDNIIIHKSGLGIKVIATKYCTISGNVIRNCYAGINLEKKESLLTYDNNKVIIDGNIITDNEGAGIEITSAIECKVTNNIVKNSGSYGIHLINAIRCDISDNTFIDSNASLSDSEAGNSFDGNTNCDIKHNRFIVTRTGVQYDYHAFVRGSTAGSSTNNNFSYNECLPDTINIFKEIDNAHINERYVSNNGMVSLYWDMSTTSITNNNRALSLANSMTTTISSDWQQIDGYDFDNIIVDSIDNATPWIVSGIDQLGSIIGRRITVTFNKTNIRLVTGGNIIIQNGLSSYVIPIIGTIITFLWNGSVWEVVSVSANNITDTLVIGPTDDLASALNSGKHISLIDGVYNVTSIPAIAGTITIEGHKSTIIDGNNALFIHIDYLSEITFRNIIFRNFVGVESYQCDNLTFEGCTFLNTTKTALLFNNGSGTFVVKDCKFDNIGTSVAPVNGDNHNFGYAIFVSGGTLEVINCEMSRTHGDSCIMVYGVVTEVNVRNSKFHDTFYGAMKYFNTNQVKGDFNDNKLWNIGTSNTVVTGVGSSAIYSMVDTGLVNICRNSIINVTENAIEGAFMSVVDNYINGTGINTTLFPTPSTEGMFVTWGLIARNTVRNTKGKGILCYYTDTIEDFRVIDNIVYCDTINTNNGIELNSTVGYTNIIIAGNKINNFTIPIFYNNAGVRTKVFIDNNYAINSVMPIVTTQRALGTAIATTTGTISVTMDSDIKTITPTGACTFNATSGIIGNRCTFVVTTSGTTTYTLTFSTNFKATATLVTGTVTAKRFCISFLCVDGTLWIETGRTIAM